MQIRLITIAGAVVILMLIIELVRRRKLKEEYSLLWVFTAGIIVVLSIWYSLLVKLTHLIGGTVPSSTLFFFGLIFVTSLLLHFSVRISLLERRITSLVQEIGLLTLTSQEPEVNNAESSRSDRSDQPDS